MPHKPLKPHKIQKYGWVPDLPDARDHMFLGDVMPVQVLPAHVDLTPSCPPVYDQGSIGSCTANAIAGAIEYDLLKQKLPDFTPSRLFIYYSERQIEGTINTDSGAMIRDGIKSVNSIGACHETLCPYDVNQFTVKPSPSAYADALQHKAVSYKRIYNNMSPSLMKLSLANGIPFVFGFTVYDSFESQPVAQTGVVPMPDMAHEQVLGGHATLAVGYDDPSERVIARNSWGPNWGNKGYFTIPYAYLTNPNLADDFWAVQIVT